MSKGTNETLVKLREPISDEAISLSTLDQQAQRNYAKMLLIFQRDPSTKVGDLVHQLKQGLEVALSEIPDFASLVAPLPRSTRKELELQLSPESGVPMSVVDYTDTRQEGHVAWTYGSYDELASQGFPMADIPKELLFIHHPSPEDAPAMGIPALTVQLNFIDGGLVMGICWHHTVGDARSVNIFLQSWAAHTKTCIMKGRTDPPTTPSEQTRERWRLDYGSKDVSIEQLSDYVINRASRSPLNPYEVHLLDRHDEVTVPNVISVWYFSSSALKSLRKSLILPGSESDMGVTQSEALAALIWKHLSLARQLGQNGISLFTTRVDYRARFNPPLDNSFIGNINEPNVRMRLPLHEVCAPSTPKSINSLAQAIRSATKKVDEAAVRAVIGLVDSLPAVTDLTWDYRSFPGPDFSVTDMSGMDTLRQDWGGSLGCPTRIRSYTRETGLVYVLPQDTDGGVEVQLQCEKEAVLRLLDDVDFMHYARFRC